MRYSTPVCFQRIQSDFNASTGNSVTRILSEEVRYADITDTGTETLQLIYGSIKQGALTVRLQRPYEAAFDRISIGGKLYRVDRTRLNKRVFIVSEVQ
jgi:hypothetical protein